MEVGITTRHCDLPEPVRQRAESRLRRLERYDPRLSSAVAVFTTDHGEHVVELILHVAGERPMVGRASGSTFGPALDRACRRAGRQLKRQRERSTERDAVRLTDLEPVEATGSPTA